MLAEEIIIAVRFVMKDHYYTFDGKIRKQLNGGPIELDLTGDVAKFMMVWWYEKMSQKLKEEGIEPLMY